jgi:hypothetical protein
MDNEATARLKFDRRLASRRGWVEPEELEQELASLPDASDKIQEVGEEPQAKPAPEPGSGTGSDGGMPDA